MEQRWTLRDGEVIDRNLLLGLAILAKANGRSVIEELNIALSSYVLEELPLKLGDDGSALLAGETCEGIGLTRKISASQSK